MGCGASKEGAAHSPIAAAVAAATAARKAAEARSHGEFRDGFDDDEDSGASRANRAVELIARACNGVQDHHQSERDDHACQDKMSHSGAASSATQRLVSTRDGLEVGVVPARDGEMQRRQVQQAESQSQAILPKVATAALEAIVAPEEDVQSQKVAAAVAAIREILFGNRDIDDYIDDDSRIVPPLVKEEADKFESPRGGISKDELSRALEMVHALNYKFNTSNKENENILNRKQRSYKSSENDNFLFDYCQKLRANGYRMSPPSSSLSTPTSAADTLMFVQDFLEEIDLTISATSVATRDVCSNTTPRILLQGH